MKTTDEVGPIYGVPLIDVLPLGSGSMKQAMPGREDLRRASMRSERTAAGYEVLLNHYRNQCEELSLWRWLVEMHCNIFLDADITRADKWLVVDIDGDSVGRGETPIAAIENARTRIEGETP